MGERRKYTLEYPINATPELLYSYLSTASGLADWFADDVNINGEEMQFIWEGDEEIARIVRKKANKMIKFQWVNRDSDEYLTFEIEKDDLTGDTALLITDFDVEEELEEARMMWDSAIDQLKSTIGG